MFAFPLFAINVIIFLAIDHSHLKIFTRVVPLFLYCYAWGVQPAKREEDWGRGLLGCVAIRCA